MKIGIYILKIGAKILYFFMKFLPMRNKIVLISRFNSETSIDFKLLKNEINIRNNETKVVILNHKMRSKRLRILDILIEMYHLATSRAAIIDSYIVPVSILKHKRQLKIIQIWHALGAIKKFGHDALGTKEGSSKELATALNMHKNYDYVISGGKGSIPHFAKAFNIDEKIIMPYGLPRVDYLLNKVTKDNNKLSIYETYPNIKNKKTILYAPTFRKRQTLKLNALINSIDTKKYNLIIKLHPLDRTKVDSNDSVIADKKYNVLELLSVSDYVITDYSAVAFEAATLEIPLLFYVYDVDQYKKNRGLNVDLFKEMKGVTHKTAKGISKAIETDYDYKQLIRFKEKYVEINNKKATTKILDLLEIGDW